MLYGQLQNGEIAMLFLRLQNRKDALKTPVQLGKSSSSKLGDFGILRPYDDGIDMSAIEDMFARSVLA